MSSSWESSSSSPLSQDSSFPPTRSTSSTTSVVSINSVDSSFQRTQEDEAGLVPLLDQGSGQEEQEEETNMGGLAPRKPAPAAALPQRRGSLGKMVNDVQDYFKSGPVIGKTRSAEIVEQTQDLTFNFNPSHKHEKVDTLTEGSEGQCYVMKSANTGKLFVLKHTKPVEITDPKDREVRDSQDFKFPQEARILGFTLKAFSNIVQMLNYEPDSKTPGRYFLWMEYCSGGDLFTQTQHWWVKKRSPVPEQFLLHVFVSLMDGLAFIHHGLRSKGDGRYTEDEFHEAVIHGDLKPDNIFLRWTDKTLGGMPDIVIGDWGVAKLGWKKNVKLNAGTPKYHAPEDAAIAGDTPSTLEYREIWLNVVNSRTTAMDMYAAGQIMYQLAARENEPRPIGLDPADLRISREYDTPGVREAIIKCLTVNKSKRAQASFHERIGLLPEINKLRTAQNALVARRMPLDRMEWARPQPK